MKLLWLVALLVILLPTAAAQDPVKDPGKVNQLLQDFETPQLQPGQRGILAFTLFNPYSDNMTNVFLNVSIAKFATIEGSRFVDASWKWETPYFSNATSEDRAKHQYTETWTVLGPGESRRIFLEVVTSTNAPYGPFYSQGTYFVRSWLEFDYVNATGVTLHYVMASSLHFPRETWELAQLNPDPDSPDFAGNLNLTLLGVDGVIPDTGFGVMEPIPMWPFYLLVVLTVLTLVLALMYYLEENPGTWPWVERHWLQFKGAVKSAVRRPKKPEKER
jgi:hypothetical protein